MLDLESGKLVFEVGVFGVMVYEGWRVMVVSEGWVGVFGGVG